MTNERKLAPGSLSIIAAALRFLFHVTLKREWALEEIPIPKKPLQLPVILSQEEVTRFLECIASLKHRTILMTAYAAGLRVSETVHLKVTDIDSQRMVIRVEQGKCAKNRYVMLSPRLGCDPLYRSPHPFPTARHADKTSRSSHSDPIQPHSATPVERFSTTNLVGASHGLKNLAPSSDTAGRDCHSLNPLHYA